MFMFILHHMCFHTVNIVSCIHYSALGTYCLTSVEQHQAATSILVALERCCSSEVLFNGKCHCTWENFLPFERGSRLLEVPL